MLVSCWSVKGGVGTTVVATALAVVLAARSPAGSVLADLVGDCPAVLGIPDPPLAWPGLAGWLAAGPETPADALRRLELPAAPGVALLPRGDPSLRPAPGRARLLAAVLDRSPRVAVADCGQLPTDAGVGTAGGPGGLAKPGGPGIPDGLGGLGIPGQRGGPRIPDSPGIPAIPAIAGIPAIPGSAGGPGIPGIPGIPVIADGPGSRGMPGIAGGPGSRGVPGKRGDPRIPGGPGIPGIPAVSDGPGVTGSRGPLGGLDTPGSPGGPGDPGRSAAAGGPGPAGGCAGPGVPNGPGGSPGSLSTGRPGAPAIPGIPRNTGSPGPSRIAGSTGASGIPGTSGGGGRPGGPSGPGATAAELVAHARRSLLVIRPCYLALRRAAQAPLRPTGVVLIREPGRVLTTADVEQAVGAPVVATLELDPAVARTVDAGLLATRLPRSLGRPLSRAIPDVC